MQQKTDMTCSVYSTPTDQLHLPDTFYCTSQPQDAPFTNIKPISPQYQFEYWEWQQNISQQPTHTSVNSLENWR